MVSAIQISCSALFDNRISAQTRRLSQLICTLDSVVGLELRSVLVLNELTKLRDSLVDLQFKGINEVTCPLDMFVRSQVLKFLASHFHFEGTEIAST